MTLTPRNDDKHCLIACDKFRVDAGLCDCINKGRNRSTGLSVDEFMEASKAMMELSTRIIKEDPDQSTNNPEPDMLELEDIITRNIIIGIHQPSGRYGAQALDRKKLFKELKSYFENFLKKESKTYESKIIENIPINNLSNTELRQLGFKGNVYYRHLENGGVILAAEEGVLKAYVSDTVVGSQDYAQLAKGVETVGDLILLCRLINGKPEE